MSHLNSTVRVSQDLIKEASDLDIAGKDIKITEDQRELARLGVSKERKEILDFRDRLRTFASDARALGCEVQAEGLLANWNSIKKAVKG